jgi:uncharacterized membrane protein YccC
MVAGAVAAIICVGTGLAQHESAAVFAAIVERVLETGTGVLVYTLVFVFLWPQSTKPVLYDTSHEIGIVQGQLFRAYWDCFAGPGKTEGFRQLRMRQAKLLTQLGQVRVGAEADSQEVWERRHAWQRFQQLSAGVADALESWRATFNEAGALDLPKLLPTLDADCAELDNRLSDIGSMLGGRSLQHDLRPLDLATSESHADGLNHFQKAALATTRSELRRLDRESQALFDCVVGLKNHRPEPSNPPPSDASAPNRLSIDLDRLGAVTRVLAGLWMAFLIWIYVDGIPQAHMFIILSVVFGIVLVQVPWLPVVKLFVPYTVAAVLAGLIYVFVMPELSGFVPLASLIFVVMFLTSYLLANPKLTGLKTIGLVVFLLLIDVSNEQTYSFTTYANLAVAMALSLIVLVAASMVPTSPRPEKAFVRLLKRFFRHAEVLVSRLSLDWRRERGWAGRWETALYANDLSGLPQKIGEWSAQIDHGAFPENSPEQVQALVDNLDILAHRIDTLIESRQRPQAQVLTEKLFTEVLAWRLALQETFRVWSTDPSADLGGDLQARLAKKYADMEVRISEVLSGCDEGSLTDQDYENFYRLLIASRSLTQAVIAYGRLVGGVTWTHWQETRL